MSLPILGYAQLQFTHPGYQRTAIVARAIPQTLRTSFPLFQPQWLRSFPAPEPPAALPGATF